MSRQPYSRARAAVEAREALHEPEPELDGWDWDSWDNDNDPIASEEFEENMKAVSKSWFNLGYRWRNGEL